MYAVIKTGGKQYKVSENDIIRIEKVTAEPGEIVNADSVFAVHDQQGKLHLGAPVVEGATVRLEVLMQKRTRKIVIFKKRRRKNSRRKRGYRHHLTHVRVLEILTGGAAPSKQPLGLPEKIFKVKQEIPAVTIQGDIRPFAKLDAAEGAPDNLQLISGVGPALEKTLNENGVFHYWQIIGMSDAEAEKFDEEADLKGRVLREDWRTQAQELSQGLPPRAKVDKKAAEAEKAAEAPEKDGE